MTKKIKEVIVVEGRDDTKRLMETFGQVDTIETIGSAIDDETIERIALAQEKRGVIVFTDPDFPGEKIRKIISREVPGVKHAFLPVKDALPGKKGSLGVEHATPEAIRQALSHLYTQEEAGVEQITQADLLAAELTSGPNAKKRRERLGDLLHIGYTNGKQLHKRLQLFQISQQEFAQALQTLNQLEEIKHD